tara:strand:+ start:114 stop:872 length:759 start_codon:yes stop_codon:yes gene_type:complete
MVEIFILSVVQGITEFLPISSSSHLILISKYLNFENQNLSVDISLHIGSFLAVIIYFSKDILDFIKNKVLFLKIIISSLPVMVMGFLLIKNDLINALRSIEVIGWATLIFGIILYISDRFKIENKIEKNFSFKSAIFIGILQVLSLIPGVSRSGISITAARLLKFDRFDSVKISFFLSIPTLGAVSSYGLYEILSSENINFSLLNLISIFFSFIFSYLTIKYFLNFVKSFNLNVFIFYRVSLGIVILIFAYL